MNKLVSVLAAIGISIFLLLGTLLPRPPATTEVGMIILAEPHVAQQIVAEIADGEIPRCNDVPLPPVGATVVPIGCKMEVLK